MEHRSIPGTDLNPSVICFGGNTLSMVGGRDRAFRQLDLYAQAGGDFIDTANIYGKWLAGETNLSEQYIGEWLSRRGMRSRIVLVTKGGHPHMATLHIPRLGRQELLLDLEESLQALRTDHIDLYFLHRDDEQRPVEEILESLEEMRRQGKIRWYGCSNWRYRRIREAFDIAKARGYTGFCANQTRWSLASPNLSALADPSMVPMETETLQLHREEGWAAMLYSSQAGGYFSKLQSMGKAQMTDRHLSVYDNPTNDRRFAWAMERAGQLDCTVGEIVLGYL
ncbi:MAG TPA: aldo/keto reductase, partial [Clostridia bacterium]